MSASPFTDRKMAGRKKVTGLTAKYFRAPLVYVNMVGAQDELIYDGRSFAIDSKGKVLASCAMCEEDLSVVDIDRMEGGHRQWPEDVNEQRRQALVLGIRDFCRKIGIQKVHLGLSGGIDSAVVACLAVEALGPFNVATIAMPGPYSSKQSLKWAKRLSENLGTHWYEMPISSVYEAALGVTESAIGKIEFGLVNENIQARSRAILLMAYSNRENSLLLNTSNKSEMAMGYTTLYGDMCGGLCPIGDLLKMEVYELARYYNKSGEIIPQAIIDRPPSAELRPRQRDTDSLPAYDKLDPSVEKLVEEQRAPRGALEKRILLAMMGSEFKRWQAPPILKVSNHAFGRGRRLPIAHKAFF